MGKASCSAEACDSVVRRQAASHPRVRNCRTPNRSNVVGCPDLFEPVGSPERDADAQAPSGPAGAARQATRPTSRTSSLAQRSELSLTTTSTAPRDGTAHALTTSAAVCRQAVPLAPRGHVRLFDDASATSPSASCPARDAVVDSLRRPASPFAALQNPRTRTRTRPPSPGPPRGNRQTRRRRGECPVRRCGVTASDPAVPQMSASSSVEARRWKRTARSCRSRSGAERSTCCLDAASAG